MKLYTCAVLAITLTASSRTFAEPMKIRPVAVTASSSYTGKPPSQAIDGNPDTEWNSGGYAPAWIMLDLGRPMPIGKIRLLTDMYPAPGNVTLTVEVGAATTSMRTVYKPTLYATDQQWIELAGDGNNGDHLGTARYVLITTNASPTWIAWREIEVDSAVEYFGYYRDANDGVGDPSNSGDFISQTTAAGSNLVWIGTADANTLVTRLGEAEKDGVQAVVDLGYICWSGTTLLRDASGKACPAFDTFASMIDFHGLGSSVAAFYLIDEPYGNWGGHSPASVTDVNDLGRRVKAAYPHKPTFVISDAASMSSTATAASYASVDWVGFDCYGCGATSLDSLVAKTRSLLSPAQRMVAMPQSYLGVRSDISSGAQYRIITGDTNYWHQKVLSDAKFVAVVPFLWTDIREGYYGARDMPWIKERMYQLEESVMPLPDNRVYPLLITASGTYVPNQSPFAAFNDDPTDIWNSGGYATQWIEGTLGGMTPLNRIVLKTNMTPAGSATHALWAHTASGWQLLQTFQGNFSDGQQLQWFGAVDADQILVVTSQSASWVAWFDITMYRP